MSLTTYNLIHLTGLAALLVALGGMAGITAAGQDLKGSGQKALLMSLHGAGLVLMIVAGFGQLARLGVAHAPLPGWAWMKLVLWIVVGLFPLWLRKSPKIARLLLFVLPLLVFAGGYLALYRP